MMVSFFKYLLLYYCIIKYDFNILSRVFPMQVLPAKLN